MCRRRRTIGVARLRDAAAQQLGVARLANDDLGCRALLGQHPGDAVQRSAGAIARHPIVQPISGKIVEYLARGGPRVNLRIGFILELPGHEPPVSLGKLNALVDHAHGTFRGGRHDDLGAKEPHQLAPLDTERLRHRDHERISLGGTDHRQANSGISAGCLDDGLAGLQLSGFFGRLDDAQSQPVLDRAERVESFNLDKKIHALGRQPVDPHHRCIANRLKDSLIFPSHYASPDIASGATCDNAYRTRQYRHVNGHNGYVIMPGADPRGSKSRAAPIARACASARSHHPCF